MGPCTSDLTYNDRPHSSYPAGPCSLGQDMFWTETWQYFYFDILLGLKS